MRVCSEVCGCAARSVGVQRGRRVCSEVGGCPASQEGVQRVRECAARLNKVYRVGPCAAKNTRKHSKSKFHPSLMHASRIEQLKGGSRTTTLPLYSPNDAIA